MNKEQEKLKLLMENGFTEVFDRMVYVNRERKKVFSCEAIEDHDLDWIRNRIDENNQDLEFYFNEPVAPKLKMELMAAIGS